MNYCARRRDAMTVKELRSRGGSVQQTVAEWTSRELQLTRLHEELVSKREALLNCSMAYQQSQDGRTQNGVLPQRQAINRNQKLLQDIKQTQHYLYDEMDKSPTPRFMTLQKNYWAMVKSQVPMWEADLGIQRPQSQSRSRSLDRKSPAGQQATQTKKTRSRRSKTPR